MLDHTWIGVVVGLYGTLSIIFDKLAKRYKKMIYILIVLQGSAAMYFITYVTYHIIKLEMYTTPLVTIFIGTTLILVVRTSSFIINNIRKLKGDTSVPTFRIYKESTPFLKRFLIESVVTLISVPILYSLGQILYNYEWKWVEPIGAMVVLVVISALLNYKKWWDKEMPDEV